MLAQGKVLAGCGRGHGWVLPTLGLAALGMLSAVSLFIGVSDIEISDVWRGDPSKMLPFVESRIPRLAAVLLSGSAIGVVGLIIQSLVRNRFVAPTTAGTVDAASLDLVVATVSVAGASVFVKMAIAVVFALAGTGLFLFLVLAQRVRYSDIIVVPLIGIMLGSVLQAIATFLAMRYGLLQSLGAWTNGDFSGVLRGRYESLYLVGALTIVAYLFANRFALAGMGRDVGGQLRAGAVRRDGAGRDNHRRGRGGRRGDPVPGPGGAEPGHHDHGGQPAPSASGDGRQRRIPGSGLRHSQPHDINFAGYHAGPIVAMKDGRVLAYGIPEAILTATMIEKIFDLEVPVRYVDSTPVVAYFAVRDSTAAGGTGSAD